MVIDPHRRQTLAGLAALAGLGPWAFAPASAFASNNGTVQLAAAWERNGNFHIGLLSTPAGAGQPLQIHASLEVPTRAHGLYVLPDGSVLATARRPGDWLVRWMPSQRAEPQWLWQDGERSFNGHVIASADGARLFTTETDVETGASWIGVRDARSLQKTADWPTHGIDAHELTWDLRTMRSGAPSLIVANGGVPTAPETGRVKRALGTMDSSIVRLDGHTGQLRGQWRLQDQRLSLRHLAWSPDGTTLGIALQAEHDNTATKDAAPVLALFDGTALRVVPTPEPIAQNIHGYGGSMAATPAGWAVSCPRANGIATYTPQGEWRGLVPLPEVCPLAVHGGALWAGGLGASLQNAQAAAPIGHPHGRSLHGVRLDNHWVLAAQEIKVKSASSA
ncbi:MAG: DUF1513 domain-containing protein [Gammaproteobacteria bacterium]|nr:DUF1513 domain-containing protein [Gammaproteobacteria bacterium]MBU0892562.1 DUF1513 domain-containing protein [Gammaproteobacteria bacterium]MBU1815983.1 DUF1513 domain-containing protein [Gammaproteobacteria bacterium]